MSIYKVDADNAIDIKILGQYVPYTLHKMMGGDSSNYDAYSKKILDFKEAKAHVIKEFCATIESLVDGGFTICTVPSHDPERGGGALAVLAEQLSGKMDRLDGSACLQRHTKIPKLAAGGSRDEQVHLDSISVVEKKLILKRSILLIDDVRTSGGSLSACKKLLLRAGATKVWCLALAQTQ